jgi:hypothetical protein
MTTLPSPRVRVPRHIARLVTRLVTPLVVDYSALRRLVVDYFVFAARPSASACRAARHVAHRAAHCRLVRLAQARHRLLHLRRPSGCLGTSRGSSRGSSCRSSSTTPRCAVSSLTALCVATTCLAVTLALLRVRRAPPRRRLPFASCRPFILTSSPN